jgi:hypothetical protein
MQHKLLFETHIAIHMDPLQQWREIKEEQAALKLQLVQGGGSDAECAAIHQRLKGLSAEATAWARHVHIPDTRPIRTRVMDSIKADPFYVGVPAANIAFSAWYGATWWYMHARHRTKAYTEPQIEWRRTFLKFDVASPQQFPVVIKKLAMFSLAVLWVGAVADRAKE